MIVVDTNIIGYLYLTSDYSPMAEQALLKDPMWAAPLLWRSELRNVLAQYIRKDRLNLAEALAVMDEASRLMQDREYTVTSRQVLDLVKANNCYAYDCEFVALAQDLERPLVTTDKQIIKHFPGVAISLSQFVTG